MPHTHFNHPGIVLRDLYLAESDLTQTELAKGTGIPQSRVSELCSGKRDINADIALRLGKFFGIDPRSWMNMQAHHDIEEAAAAQRAAKVVIHRHKFKLATA